MQGILALLQWTRDIAGNSAVPRQNLEAAETAADDVAQSYDDMRAAYGRTA